MQLKLNLYLIRNLAQEKKVTLVTVANAIGVTYTTLQKLMKIGSTKSGTLTKICDYFEKDIHFFYDRQYKNEEINEPIREQKIPVLKKPDGNVSFPELLDNK